MKKDLIKHSISVVVVALFLIMAYGSDDQAEIQKETVAREPDYSISAEQLYAEFEANGVAADQKYKGKTLRVSGVIDDIDKDILDQIYVSIQGDGFIGGVQCFLADEHINKVVNLSKGDWITVRGVCDGQLMNVFLKGCIIE